MIKNKCTIINSHLSEFGVLGFEYGYSRAHPNNLGKKHTNLFY
jgi:2-oxoglutarate dehydrogenase complex dehydrogenase (E1) component-like enzyme